MAVKTIFSTRMFIMFLSSKNKNGVYKTFYLNIKLNLYNI